MSSNTPDTQSIIASATGHLSDLGGHTFDVLTLAKPISVNAAANLSGVISKLSPLLGNMIEFNTVEYLNDQEEYGDYGTWQRQDPGFPDTIFSGSVSPTPGIEMKAWFPLATEITARFRDSQDAFSQDNTHVAMIAWIPENLIFGKPRILDVCVVSAKSVAEARDAHYHNPPDYLVIEPEDTAHRKQNLQQSNTAGYRFQGSPEEFEQAKKQVHAWGPDATTYSTSPEYQNLVRDLMQRFRYRLDTNFAKMDRIAHTEIEQFKASIYNRTVCGLPISQWRDLIGKKNDYELRKNLRTHLEIVDRDADQIIR